MTSNREHNSLISHPLSNAADSLNRAAAGIEALTGGDQFAIKPVLQWTWHALGLVVYSRLREIKDSFDAWFADYFETGEATLSVERDAHWSERNVLGYVELIDLLSEPGLSILRPDFFQGWQDRTSRCRSLREQIQEHLGASIQEKARDDILLTLAAYHRLIRLPFGTQLDVHTQLSAYPKLLDLIEQCLAGGEKDSQPVLSALNGCRSKLQNQ